MEPPSFLGAAIAVCGIDGIEDALPGATGQGLVSVAAAGMAAAAAAGPALLDDKERVVQLVNCIALAQPAALRTGRLVHELRTGSALLRQTSAGLEALLSALGQQAECTCPAE